MFKLNIEKKTLSNKQYRNVLYTTPQMQLVLMSIPVGDDIPKEKHAKVTQFIRVEEGKASVTIYKGKREEKKILKDGDAVIIDPNTYHYVKNIGDIPVKLYTLYSPPQH